jgi:hypothetical protein
LQNSTLCFFLVFPFPTLVSCRGKTRDDVTLAHAHDDDRPSRGMKADDLAKVSLPIIPRPFPRVGFILARRDELAKIATCLLSRTKKRSPRTTSCRWARTSGR